MLVRKLRKGDTFTIGDEIIVQIGHVSDDWLRLAITAPQDHRITFARGGEIVKDTDPSA